MKVLGASLDLVNKKVVNLADGTADTDATNVGQLNSAIRGLDWKQEVIAASTTNVTLATPGASLDGVTLSNPMRILLKDQTAPAENGIYVWTGASTLLTRALDADTWAEVSGATTTVQQGTVNADRVYRVTADDGGTLNTTSITLVQVGSATSYVGGDGLTLTGSTFDVGAGTGISVSASAVSVDTAVVVRKYASNMGDNTTTVFTKAHGLGTADLTVTVYTVSGGEKVYPDITLDSTNVVVTFATAPTTNQYRLVAHG